MNKPQLTRTCSSCGQIKPLSAFLQLSGSAGATYGTICSTCRSTQAAAKQTPPKESEEQTTSTTGAKIDAKVRLQTEIDKIKNFQRTTDLNLQEKKKKEDILEIKEEKIEKTEKSEKEHREGYIEIKKQQTMFGAFDKKTEAKKHAYITQEIQEKTTAAIQQSEAFDQKQTIEIKEGNVKQDKETKIDLSTGYTPSAFGHQAKYSSVWNEFKTRLGTAAGAEVSKDVREAVNKKC